MERLFSTSTRNASELISSVLAGSCVVLSEGARLGGYDGTVELGWLSGGGWMMGATKVVEQEGGMLPDATRFFWGPACLAALRFAAVSSLF